MTGQNETAAALSAVRVATRRLDAAVDALDATLAHAGTVEGERQDPVIADIAAAIADFEPLLERSEVAIAFIARLERAIGGTQ